MVSASEDQIIVCPSADNISYIISLFSYAAAERWNPNATSTGSQPEWWFEFVSYELCMDLAIVPLASYLLICMLQVLYDGGPLETYLETGKLFSHSLYFEGF